MRALIIKDWQWLLLFLVGGLITFIAVGSEIGFNSTFVFHDLRFVRWILPIWWSLALGLGVCAAISDEVQGTQDYARHRPLTLLRFHAVKVFACCLIMVSWLVLPLLLLALLGTKTFQPDYLGLGLDKFLYGTLMFTFFAIAYFCGNFSANGLVRILLAATMVVPLVLQHEIRFSYWRPVVPNAWAFAALHLALAAILLHGSWLCIKSGRDPDLPAPSRVLWPVAIASIAFVWLGDMLLRECADWEADSMKYPRLAKTAKGKYHLVKAEWNRAKAKAEYWWVDANHQVAGEAKGFTFVKAKGETYRRYLECRYFDSQIGWFEGAGDLDHIWTFFDKKSGYMQHHIKRKGPSYQSLSLGKGKANEAFSPRAQPVSVRRIPKIWIGDPEDGSLFVCDFTKKHPIYEPIALPSNDRFVQWSSVSYSQRSALEALLPPKLRARADLDFISNAPILVGKKTAYVLGPLDNQLMPLGGALSRQYFPDRKAKKATATFVIQDLTHPKLEVRDAAGKLLFSHQFAPRTFHERFVAAGLYIQSLCRSPLLQLIRFNADAKRSVVANGRHSGILLLNFLVAAVLAFLAIRRLSALGQNSLQSAFWGTAILIGGLCPFIVYRVMENKRAYRPCKVLATEDARPLLIKSA